MGRMPFPSDFGIKVSAEERQEWGKKS